MKKPTIFVLALMAALGCRGGVSQKLGQHEGAKAMHGETFRWEMTVGRLGIINSHLYVVTRSEPTEQNTIIIKPTDTSEERWYGKNIAVYQVVFFYKGKIWSPESLPEGFDMSEAIMISFEKEKIHIFDFSANRGMYYARLPER